MKLKDFVTLGNVLGGLASMVSAIHGDLQWACYFMFIAWAFDSMDGTVARLTGGGNKFGVVLDNTADLVAYSLAPALIVYLAYVSPRVVGGAGWPPWAAFILASLPAAFGCIRFARNDVKDIIMPTFHMGLPRTVYGLYIATLFTSHIFRNSWITDPSSWFNPVIYAVSAVFIATTSFLILTLLPYYAKPKRGSGTKPFIVFSVWWFLLTTACSLVVGLLYDMRIFLDTAFLNFTVYVWFQHLAIPPEKRREAKRYVKQLTKEWKQEMG